MRATTKLALDRQIAWIGEYATGSYLREESTRKMLQRKLDATVAEAGRAILHTG